MEEKDYALIPIGTEVSAKYRGAFCEAKIGKISKCVKCRVVFDGEQGSSVVLDENIRGPLKIGEKVDARTSPTKPYKRATVVKIVDHTIYTVVFNDGDQRSLKRNQLCIKGDKHFTENESLDSMPLVHPEEFGSPVVNRDKKDRDDSSVGQLVCVEVELKPNGQSVLCPCLIVAADPQGRRAKKDQLIVRSFLDNKFMTVQRKEAKPFKINDSQMSTSNDNNSSSSVSEEGPNAKGRQKGNSSNNNDDSGKQQQPTKALAKAYERASTYWENDVLPDNWNRSQLLDAEDEPPTKQRPSRIGSDDGEDDDSSSSLSSFESSDEEGQPSEERDRFVAQLYRFMDERGTPLNKAPSLANKDLDLYRLYSIVQHCGGFNRVNRRDKWLSIYKRMHIPTSTSARSQIIRAYKKYLQPFEEFYRKLGSTMGTVDVYWGRTRHASSRAFISTREKSQSRSESRLNSSGSASTAGASSGAANSTTTTNNNSTTPSAPGGSNNNNNTTAASLSAGKHQGQSTAGKSPSHASSEVPTGSSKGPMAMSTPLSTGAGGANVASSTLSSRRSSAMAESDSGVSDKTPLPSAMTSKQQQQQSVASRRNRRESQSKDAGEQQQSTTEQPQSTSAQRNRRSASGQAPSQITSTGRGGRVGSRSGPPGRGSQAGDNSDDDDDDNESSDNDNRETGTNDDNASTQSGDDSSSTTEFGTSLSLSVAAAAGLSATPSAALPLDTTVKVRCGRGSVTAHYEGKITAKRRETDGEFRYHIHYRGWNSRYDEWIVAGRISEIIRIGDESAAVEQQPSQQQTQQQPQPGAPISSSTNSANVNSSRASSVPNSVVSASESDVAGSNDEQQQRVQVSTTTTTTAAATEVSAGAKQPEDSPDKDAVSNSSGPSTSPENNNVNDNVSSNKLSSSANSNARKRKADDQVKQGPTEKNGTDVGSRTNNGNSSSNGKDKDSSSESCSLEKQPKNAAASNITTRSTRGKPGEETQPSAPPNGARGSHGPRRGGHRSSNVRGATVSLKDEPTIDPSDANSEKAGNVNKAPLSNTQQAALSSAVAAAIAASKSPSKVAAEHTRRLNRPNKFNFRFEDIDKCANRDQRIAFIMGKISEIRNLYGDLKSKVADIDKKRRLYRSYMSSSKKDAAVILTSVASVTIKQQGQSECAVANFTQSLSFSSEAATSNDKDIKARPQ